MTRLFDARLLSTRFALLVSFAALATTTAAHDPAKEMATAAARFVTSLDEKQKAKATFDFKSKKRQGWNYLPDKFIKPAGKRFGLSFKEMKGGQRALAHGLLNSALSHRGYLQAMTIVSLEQILHDLENKNPIRNPDLYYVSIFGKPAAAGTWAWRFEGHHLSVNVTIVKGKLFSVTPSFWGANPGEVRSGRFSGLRTLKQEVDLARALVKSLSPEQRKLAIIAAKAPRDVITGWERKANKGLFTPAVGIPLAKLNDDQKQQLRTLIGTYAGKFRTDVVKKIEARTKLSDEQDVHFAWAGGVEPGEGHYYRIQTPRFLFEYDNTQNGANHIHAVWRDFAGDFGEDLLRKHYDEAHRKKG